MKLRPLEVLRPLTIDDLDRFDEMGTTYEIIGGELHETGSHTLYHGQWIARLFEPFRPHLRSRTDELLYTFGPNVQLSRHDVLTSDLFLVSRKANCVVLGDFVDGPPDLVVEVVSPESRRTDYVLKPPIYERSGVQEYWLVDPARKVIEISSLTDHGYEISTFGESTEARSLMRPSMLVNVEEFFGYGWSLPEAAD